MRYENVDGGRKRGRTAYTSRMPGCLRGVVLRMPAVGHSRQKLCGRCLGFGGVGVASFFGSAVGGGNAGHAGQKTWANSTAEQIRQYAARNAQRSFPGAEGTYGPSSKGDDGPGAEDANSARAWDRQASGGSGSPPERGGWRGDAGHTRYGTGRET